MSLNTINNIINDDNIYNKYLSNILDISNNNLYLRYFGASKNRKNILYISKNYYGLIFRHFDFINDIDQEKKY